MSVLNTRLHIVYMLHLIIMAISNESSGY